MQTAHLHYASLATSFTTPRPSSRIPCSIIASPPHVHNRCHIHSAQTNQNSPPTTHRRLSGNYLNDDAKKVIRDANAKRSKPVKIDF